jgi:porin
VNIHRNYWGQRCCYRFIVLLIVAVLNSNTALAGEAQTDDQQGLKEAAATEISADLLDDSYTHPETLKHRSGFNKRPNFGSTASTAAQLEEDDRVKDPVIRFPAIDQALDGWFAAKKRLNEVSFLQLGFDYNTLYQAASEALGGDDNAWSGVFRIFGKWDVVNPGGTNTGSIVFGLENRHRIDGRIPPSALAGEVGYIGVTGTLFSDVESILGNLYYQQRLGSEDQGGIIIGRFDPNDFMDVLGYANPWTTFSNVAILLNPTIALPDWSWGVGGGSRLNGQWYVLGSINDANGTITNESFFDGGSEFFSQVEVGWSPSRAERYFTNVHLTAWHVDEREEAGIPSAQGLSLGANKTWNETWMAFSRVGWSEGDAPIYNKSVTFGVGRLIRQWSDVFGVGVNWGDPTDDSLRSQWTTEVFYRMQLSQNLQITPSVQWLIDPALNTTKDETWIMSFRLRFSF